MHLDLAIKLFDLARPAEAARSAYESLEVARRIGDRIGIVYAVALLARAAAERGDEELAGRLWGAVDAEFERVPVVAWEADRDEIEQHILARTGAGFEAGRAEGGRLSLEDAAELALAAED